HHRCGTVVRVCDVRIRGGCVGAAADIFQLFVGGGAADASVWAGEESAVAAGDGAAGGVFWHGIFFGVQRDCVGAVSDGDSRDGDGIELQYRTGRVGGGAAGDWRAGGALWARKIVLLAGRGVFRCGVADAGAAGDEGQTT